MEWARCTSRATCCLPDMRKVIKVLLPVYAANPLICQRFHREAEAASKLRHDCILGIDNFGTLDDGQLFIMSPYLEGQSLDSYLRGRGGRLAPHRALHLIVQLCDALDHAHGNGIIHRDPQARERVPGGHGRQSLCVEAPGLRDREGRRGGRGRPA